MKRPDLQTSYGQASWRLASSTVEAFVTQTGGHLAPVTFDRRGGRFQPFALAPWWNESLPPSTPTLLQVLRGDFFCFPFGANTTPFGREQHSLHGETANRRWTCRSLEHSDRATTLHLRMKTRTRPAQVDRFLSLVDGHDAVYSRTVVSGASGPMCVGHHATLRFPDQPGCGLISTSGFQFGQVCPLPAELPEAKGYSLLLPGARFRRLDRVPTLTGDLADLSRYPARRGFEDLALLVGKTPSPFAWTAVSFPDAGYVWFALKDPRVLRHTLLWMSNGGRHYPPWNGRHVNVMGLEDLTAYFHYGLAESAGPNPLQRAGHPTCLRLNPKQPLVVNYIMAVARIPRRFDRVKTIRPARGREEAVTLVSGQGPEVTVPLNYRFVLP